MTKSKYQDFAREIRKDILKMHFLSKESHVASALSCADIIAVLYGGILHIDPKTPLDKDRDRFILSKGHAVACLYSALAQKKFFSRKMIETFCQDGSLLPGHATKQSVPGVEVSTGGLGHGLPMGVGIALAAKHDRRNYRVFVLMSDGECNEGTTWESALFAAHHKLDNLIVVIDKNGQQGLGRTKDIINTEPLGRKWKAFGWQIKEIDGHNWSQLEKTLKNVPIVDKKPTVVIARTTKGKGVLFMQEDPLLWHYRNPTEEQYKKALDELE